MARDLYHSALVVHSRSGPVVIEVTPVGRGDGAMRGVVASGPVGSRLLRHLRLFRYEVRRWPNGVIPDVAEAVESPARLTDDPTVSERTLRLAPDVPMLVWGRDESRTGDMWNSNSVISWLLTRSSLPAASIRPPANGRAPGWHAGVVVAHRSAAS